MKCKKRQFSSNYNNTKSQNMVIRVRRDKKWKQNITAEKNADIIGKYGR